MPQDLDSIGARAALDAYRALWPAAADRRPDDPELALDALRARVSRIQERSQAMLWTATADLVGGAFRGDAGVRRVRMLAGLILIEQVVQGLAAYPLDGGREPGSDPEPHGARRGA
jgi:hypothetical protein